MEKFNAWADTIQPQPLHYTLTAAKMAIRMEARGMKHSRGSVRKHWALLLGLKPRAKHEEVMAAIDAVIIERFGKPVEPCA